MTMSSMSGLVFFARCLRCLRINILEILKNIPRPMNIASEVAQSWIVFPRNV